MAISEQDNLEEHLIDQADGTELEGIEERVTKKTTRYCSYKYGFFLSIILNGLFCFGFYIMFKETDEASTPILPPDSNTSDFVCPFPELDLSKDRHVPAIAVTSLSSEYASFCWRDFDPETREENQGYQLILQDAWKGVTTTIYTGRGVKQNITDLLAGSNYTLTVSSLTNDKKSAKILFNTKPKGYCGNAADLRSLQKYRDVMADISADCVAKNLLSVSKQKECIKAKTSFSSGCIDCYLFEAHCSMKNCAGNCLHSRWSDKCQLCNRKYCAEENKICSGLPFWAGSKVEHHPGRR